MNHLIIVVGGLGDTGNSILKTIFWWKWFGFDLISFDTKWRSVETFEQKIKRFDKLVDSNKDKYKRISLVGTSAGGSFALNYLIANPDKIYKVVNVCGRIKVGKPTGYRNLINMAKSSKSFEQSVRLVDQKTNKTTLARLMNIRPYFDELVPSETCYLDGATNKTIFSFEHLLSIFLSLTIFSRHIIEFLAEPPLRLRGGRG